MSKILSIHKNNDQFNFKELDTFSTENYIFYRGNKYTKEMINNRHELKMSKHNWAGYGYAIFDKYGKAVGLVWFLNQVTKETTYVRISRYESMSNDNFIAVLSELNDMFVASGYSLILKTKIEYAQSILNKNFYGKESKASHSKRGVNDRSTKDVSVDGITYNLADKNDTFTKWFKHGTLEA